MPTYEIWTSADGSETALLPADHPQKAALTRDADGAPMTLQRTLEAEDWEEALAIRDRGAPGGGASR